MSNHPTCKICGLSTTNLYTNMFDDRHGYPKLFNITRCTSCGFCRTEPALLREDLAEVYQKYYPRSSLTVEQVEASFKTTQAKTNIEIWLEGGGTECYRYIAPGGTVLDVGCGNCISLLMAKQLGAKEVVGIEVDPNLSTIAQTLNLDLHIGQMSNLPSDKGNFDFILARQVLEHEPEPALLLNEMQSRLNESGQIILSFPNVNAFYRSVFKNKWLHWHVPYHINHFSQQSVIILAENCGLKIKTIATVTPNSWLTYQLRTAKLKLQVGQRDTFWDPGIDNNIELPQAKIWQWLPKIVSKIRQKAQSYFSRPFVCLTNRLIDLLGLGESFVVILYK